jgi:CheY-like chemotaxis protein
MNRPNMVPDGTNLVWVVDDSDACRRLLVSLARRGGAAVIEFASAEHAIQAASVHSWPMAVLTDLHLPGRSGLDLITHLRSVGYHGPVALITASSDESTRAAARSAGASAVVSKNNLTVAVPWFVEVALRPAGSSAA